MLTETIIILLIILLLSFSIMRSGRAASALVVLPTGIVPLSVLIANIGLNLFSLSPQEYFLWYTGFVIFGLIISGCFYGFISAKIKSKSARNIYFLVCGSFTIIYSIICIAKFYHLAII